MQPTELWPEALQVLKGSTTKSIFDTLLAPTEADYNGNGALTVYALNEMSQQRLDHQMRPLIERTVKSLVGHSIEISIEVRTESDPNDDIDDEPNQAEAEDDAPEITIQMDSDPFRPSYSTRNGNMYYTKFRTSDGSIVENEQLIAPFVARITEKKMILDDVESRVEYTIEGFKGYRKFRATIHDTDFADQKRLALAMIRCLPGKPPHTDPSLRRHWGSAISALTDEETMAEITAYTSTGWTPDSKAFVMPGGGYGKGYLCQFPAELQKELSQFNLTKRSPVEVKKVVNLFLYGLTKIYKPAVIFTLLAHAFLAPLIKFCGDDVRYLYHIHANTGSLKTELAKLVMGLYGPIESHAITYKWSMTPYGAESRANALKDCLFLVDDLKPGLIAEADQAKWVAFVQAAVDAQGRKRATISGGASASRPPRALVLSTGEVTPEAGESSYTARMLLAELDRQPAERNKLLDKIKTKAGLFSGLMYDYVAWLHQGKGQGALTEYKALQNDMLITNHARLSNNFASNRLGAVMFAKFCQAKGYLNEGQAQTFLDGHLAGLTEIVNRTADKVHSERYSSRFIEALQDAISSGFASLSETRAENRVGWVTDEYVCLLNGAKDIVDQWLRSSGQTTINMNKTELRKQLYDDGFAYSTQARLNQGKYDAQMKDPVTGSYQMVTAIFIDRFYQFEADTVEPCSNNDDLAHETHDLHDNPKSNQEADIQPVNSMHDLHDMHD